jgi:ribosomal protein L37AE/L43A
VGVPVIDIACPKCGAEAVQKVGLKQYRCEECRHEFGAGDVTP